MDCMFIFKSQIIRFLTLFVAQRRRGFAEVRSHLVKQGKVSPLKSLSSIDDGIAIDFDSASKYSIEILKLKEALKLPEDVDPARKEVNITSEVPFTRRVNY